MATGTVQRTLTAKGFGFIKPDGGGDDLFFHRSACRGIAFETMKPGTRVSFDVGRSPKGARAEDVRAT